MDVGVVSLRGVCVLPFECRPGVGVLGRANPGEVVWLAFCSRRWRWILVGVALLEELDDVVFPAFALSAVLSLATLAWVSPGCQWSARHVHLVGSWLATFDAMRHDLCL